MNLKTFCATAVKLLPLWVLAAAAQPAPGTLLWTFEMGSAASPAVGHNGVIYLGLRTGLHAITNTGPRATNLWTLAGPSVQHIAVGEDGTIYCGAYDGLYAVAGDGTKKWSYKTESPVGSPAIGSDETIYFQSAEYLYALTKTGTFKWQASMSFVGGSYSAPAVGADGTIYIGSSYEPKLFAFNPDGTTKWVHRFSSPMIGDSPVISDGTIYITSGGLYAFTPQGTKLWGFGNISSTSPVIGQNGMLYIADSLHPYRLYRIDSHGTAFPTDATENIRYATPKSAAVDASGTAWYCASNTVWALSAEGEVLPWSQVIDDGYGAPGTSPVISPDGILYFTRGGRLYAIATGTNGPADSPWPMYRGNARHTGRIEKPSLQKPRKQANAGFGFDVYARTNKTLAVESSTNLISWQPLTNFVPTTIPAPVVDHSASNSPMKFYRAVER